MALSRCKNLSRLLREITSYHNRDFYCLNCFHSFSTETRLKKHERVCNDHDYCCVEVLNEDNKVLKYNHGEKSLKAPFLIIFDNDGLLLKMASSENNPEKFYIGKNAKPIPSGCAWSLTCSFDSTRNKHGYCRGEDCIKRLCKKIRELILEIIIYE